MFEIRLGEQGEVVCEGRLDAAQAARAQAFLDNLAAPEVIDMAALEYISSAGLGVLLRTQKRLLQAGGGLRVVNASRHIRDIFRYSGFDRIFQIDGGP
jgi:anti-sigma B factor antagonist